MYIYGPVPSRRLGRSLGVSLIPPKVCTYSCVYCQLGRTKRLSDRREPFFPKEDVLAEISERASTSDIDYITFAGDGEPTLSLDLGWLITESKNLTRLPTAVITNGSLLFRDDVRHEIARADVVLPSLDAGSQRVFEAVNRPHGTIKYTTMLEGLMSFRLEYDGEIWLEVMLVHGVNDTEEALKDIRRAIDRIEPNRLYITTPIRPPAESWVEPPLPEDIIRAQEILGENIAITKRESGGFGLDSFQDAREAILEIGSRHPLRLEQALRIESIFSEPGVVNQLVKTGELLKTVFNETEYLLPSSFVRSNKLSLIESVEKP